MKISLILKGKKDFFERYPVYIRYSDGQKRTIKKTDLLLTEDQLERFNQHSHLPKEKDLYARFLSCMDKRVEEKKEIGFFTYADYCLKSLDRAPETTRQEQSQVNKLQAFRADFNLSDVTPAFLNNYKEHLKALGNGNNTMWKAFKFIRLILRQAKKEKLIEENPFDVFKVPKYKDPARFYLTQEEIDRIEALNKKKLPAEILFTANWFLIGCYTGLRFGDMAAFDKKKHLRNKRLIMYTSKTGEIVSIPFTDKMKQLFERVDYQPMHYENQTFNLYLKQVQGLAEIGTKLTVHISRHTAAVRWANAGMSQEVVGKILGHVNLKTTSIYFKITGKRIDDEFKRFG